MKLHYGHTDDDLFLDPNSIDLTTATEGDEMKVAQMFANLMGYLLGLDLKEAPRVWDSAGALFSRNISEWQDDPGLLLAACFDTALIWERG